MRITTIAILAAAGCAALFVLVVPKWHWPVPGVEVGFPSSIQFARADRAAAEADRPPPPLPDVAPDARPATEAYRNVQVLTDLNAGQFIRLQHAITAWVSPTQGCGFCHAGDDYASDARPQKQAARVMLRMTRHVNADWQNHVAASGVTCFTCHRGQPVPAEIWFPSPPHPGRPMIAKQDDWDESAHTVRGFFPRAGFDEYLLQETPGVSQSNTALPSGEVSAQVVTKRLYEYMMQMADGIGVNCGYCHNSRAFSDWSQSTPARWIAYYGIEMTRDLNRNYLLALAPLLPQSRQAPGMPREPVIPARESGPQTGNGLVLCATCHNGAPKPLGGASMLQDYPGLRGPAGPAAAIPAVPHG